MEAMADKPVEGNENDVSKSANNPTPKRNKEPQTNSQKNNKRQRKGGVGTLDDDDECTASEVEFEIEALFPNGKERIRMVKPYPYSFSTFAKARWINRPLIDVYSKEFGSYPKSYYEAAIDEGRIRVSGKQVSTEYVVKRGDQLTHTVHRHEPAVAVSDLDTDKNALVRIVHEDSSVLVTDKPSTMPIHPCGAYHFNSLIHIIAQDRPDLKHCLFPVHRLDRLTSGLTIIAKSNTVAKSFGRCIMDRENCSKMYVARVKGKFPLDAPHSARIDPKLVEHVQYGEVPCEMLSTTTSKEKQMEVSSQTVPAYGFWATDHVGNINQYEDMDSSMDHLLQDVFSSHCTSVDQLLLPKLAPKKSSGPKEKSEISTELEKDPPKPVWLHFACPTQVLCHKNGICQTADPTRTSNKDIKPAQTSFTVMRYDSETDTTLLAAVPQTGRMHQIRLHLQHLGHPIANDPNYGGEMFFGDETRLRLSRKAREALDAMDRCTTSDVVCGHVPATREEVERIVSSASKKDNETFSEFLKRTCVWCARNSRGGDENRAKLEFLVRSSGIWLHALQYSFVGDDGERMTFRTELPPWSRF